MNADVGAGEGLAVEAEDFADARQLDAGRELLQHLFALAGFEAEVCFAALQALAEDAGACLVPAGELRDADALEDLGGALEELHGGGGRGGGELLGHGEEVVVGVLRDDGERCGALREERVGVAAAAAGDARGEGEEAAAGGGLDRLEEAGGALEADADVGPGGFADGGGQREEGGAVGLREGGEESRGGVEAGGGELVGALGDGLDERDEPGHLGERQRREDAGAGAEVDGRERDGLPVALVESLAESCPLDDGLLVEVGHALRAGLEVGGGDDGGVFGEAAAGVGPAPEGGGGHGAEDFGRDAEVVDGGLPGAEGVGGQFGALLGPGAEVGFREDGHEDAGRVAVGVGERWGVCFELALDRVEKLLVDGHGGVYRVEVGGGRSEVGFGSSADDEDVFEMDGRSRQVSTARIFSAWASRSARDGWLGFEG